MELTREHWTKEDINEFQNYLRSLEFPERREWVTNILKTSLPILVINNAKMKEISEKIAKGNYMEFLDHWVWEYYENTAINGFLITKIKDFDVWERYLEIYSNKIDSWANCDLLRFPFYGYEERLLKLSRKYTESENPFKRRIGLFMNFCYITDYIEEVFKTLDTFTNEDSYYVVMMGGWLLSLCFLEHRDETLKYLQNGKVYYKIINKGIQKCRESYKVSKEDKELLNSYKIKVTKIK